MISKFPSFNKY